MRGGGPPGYHKALPLSLVERKEKGKKGRGVRDQTRIACAIYTASD